MTSDGKGAPYAVSCGSTLGGGSLASGLGGGGGDPIGGGGSDGCITNSCGPPRIPPPPCNTVTLDDPNLFSESNFATPEQVGAFFQSQKNAPGSWQGQGAAQDFINRGINPGLVVGIVGAETSFGNGPTLSTNNIINPFSCDSSANFTVSANCAANTVAHDERITYTPNTPLVALENGANPLGRVYSATQPQAWLINVDVWFRNFARFLGQCQ